MALGTASVASCNDSGDHSHVSYAASASVRIATAPRPITASPARLVNHRLGQEDEVDHGGTSPSVATRSWTSGARRANVPDRSVRRARASPPVAPMLQVPDRPKVDRRDESSTASSRMYSPFRWSASSRRRKRVNGERLLSGNRPRWSQDRPSRVPGGSTRGGEIVVKGSGRYPWSR